MNNNLMTNKETTTAAVNLSLIESQRGKEVPTGLIDTTLLGDHILSINETVNIANNIDSIERQRKALKESPRMLSFLAIIACIILILYSVAALVLYR